MTTGRTILERAGVLLQDVQNIRWPLVELAGWTNEAMGVIVIAKPSASSRSRVLELVEGTLQSVTAAAGEPTPTQLLDVTRNITSKSPLVGGRTIRATNRAVLDVAEPNWHMKTYKPFKAEVRQFTFDEQNPLEFYVYPGNTGAGMVEAVVSNVPANLTATGDPTLMASWETALDLPGIYEAPILDYVCYRALLKDALVGDTGRSAGFYGQFATAIGLKIQVEGASSPNTRRGS